MTPQQIARNADYYHKKRMRKWETVNQALIFLLFLIPFLLLCSYLFLFPVHLY